MMPVRKLLFLACLSALILLACGVSFDLGSTPAPAAGATLARQDQISTMVAETVQALTQVPASATAASPTPTNMPVPALLSVSSATNCYGGPSTSYGMVITIRPGMTVSVVGKDTPDNYWIIDVPDYPGTVCWLSGTYASVTGDTGYLPAPATPQPSLYTLDEPRNLRLSCTVETDSSSAHSGDDEDEQWTVVFRWTNTDPNQTALRVFRNGWQVATLHAHSSSFTDVLFHRHHRHGVTYGVQAVNGKRVSSIVTIDLHRCK